MLGRLLLPVHCMLLLKLTLIPTLLYALSLVARYRGPALAGWLAGDSICSLSLDRAELTSIHASHAARQPGSAARDAICMLCWAGCCYRSTACCC